MNGEQQPNQPSGQRPLPLPDRDSAPWWAALAEHRLVQQRCGDCGRWRWPPRAMCGDCGSFEWQFEPVPGTGEVVSWITTHHAFLPGFEAPYHTVFVRLDLSADDELGADDDDDDDDEDDQDDLVLPGSWFGGGAPRIGSRVKPHFDDRHDDAGDRVTLLGWLPAPDQERSS